MKNTMKKIFLLCSLFLISLAVFPQLKSSDDSILVEVIVKDFNNKLRVHDRILFEGQKTKAVLQGLTNEAGMFQLLIPEGDVYNIVVKGLGENQEYNTFEVPKSPGRYTKAVLNIKYEPAKSFTLKNLQFESGKANIRLGSEGILNELIELMNLKPAMKIEIAGHTDDVGNDDANTLLSKNRAEAVKNYLNQKG
jgi:OOP family OmpA-OmpF porin